MVDECIWVWSIGGMINGRGKPKLQERHLFWCQLVHHNKYQMDSPGTISWPGSEKLVTDLSHSLIYIIISIFETKLFTRI
jgi:hypothetical protein